jgi:hypothetical protein
MALRETEQKQHMANAHGNRDEAGAAPPHAKRIQVRYKRKSKHKKWSMQKPKLLRKRKQKAYLTV